MKGRPIIHNNQELVQRAQEVFWEKGYIATSLADLSKSTGAGAGSIYNNFKGGKKELFRSSLQQRREDLNKFKELLERSEEPIELIKNFFLGIADEGEKYHMKGCIVANTVVEMTFVDEDLEKEAAQILKDTEELYTNTIITEQRKGNLQSTISADVLGKHLITLWCGINSLRRIYPDRSILRQQIELQLQVLQ
ncbi:TetR/AcrR family transcriptional regulator [Fulvivirga maritima]|uniref:TetR/AcrR family transcriptional regulator n=1 Tax=Fulvivirga maritima TaxID=2904247 RepID=UPI001F45ADD1|nr:TetR/AcrR family transcriptional regulator [Fulvivirga maritima]UII28293.1 TetR/AcrR family transcriptional regulator [Fulvivirga maritima]